MKKIILFLTISLVPFRASAQEGKEKSPFWRSSGFGSQALNPDISLIGDFLLRPGARESGQNALSLREAELGIQAAVDPYSRADIFVAIEEEGGKFEADLEEGFLTLLTLPWRSQAKLGRWQVDFGRTHRTHAPERDFADSPLVFEKVLGVEKAMKANGISLNSLLPLPFNSYHEVRAELGETKIQFGEEEAAIKRVERFLMACQKNFFALSDTMHLELSGGFGRWQMEGSIEQAKSTATFEGRALDSVRSIGTADFTLKWKPSAYRSLLLEGNYIYSSGRPLVTDESGGEKKIVASPTEVADRGGYLQMQIQPMRRWYFGGRFDHITLGDGGKIERGYSGIVTFFPSEFARMRFQWNRKLEEGAQAQDRFLIQVTWALGPHRPHPF